MSKEEALECLHGRAVQVQEPEVGWAFGDPIAQTLGLFLRPPSTLCPILLPG